MRKFIVSTDCCGVLGTPYMWNAAWKDVTRDPAFSGFELLAWKWLPQLIKKAHACGIKTFGVHGKVNESIKSHGAFDKLTMSSIEFLMASHSKVLTLKDNFEYILFHENALTESDIDVLTKTPNCPLIMIENVISPGAYEQALKIISELNARNIQAGLMFDLAHYLREPNFDTPDMGQFDKLVSDIAKLKDASFPVSFHIPIGTYLNDSIPIDTMTEGQLSSLAHSINITNPSFVVLENQQRRAYSLYEPPWAFNELVTRNQKIFEILRNYKII